MQRSENQNIEWKQTWKDEYLKWICGFSNAQGGKIFIGLDDNGLPVGLENTKTLLEDIPNKVRDVLGIIVDVNLKVKERTEYVEVVVAPSSSPVNYKGEYHYRSGSTKQILKGASLTEFLTSRTGHTWDDVPVDRVGIEDLDDESFELFRKLALKSGRMDEIDLKISNEQLLDNLGLLHEGKLIRAGILLFHKKPTKILKGAYIKIGFFETDADLLYQDEIHGSLFQQAEKIMDILYTKYLKATIAYDGITRIEQYPFPKEALREALFNAITHKNYATQIPIQVSVYGDKLYISNDCIFPIGWTARTLFEKHRSKPYNPSIANGFFRAGLVETWGRGIEKICEACKKYEIPHPEYRLYSEDIMVKFLSKSLSNIEKGTNEKTTSERADKRTSGQANTKSYDYVGVVTKYLEQVDSGTTKEISELIGLSVQRTRVILNKMVDEHLIQSKGATNKRVYYLSKEEPKHDN